MTEVHGDITPIKNKVLVHNIEEGQYVTKGGIIVLDDNGKERGIRERWAQVYAIGPDIEDIAVGDWVLIKHGRWSRGVDIINRDGEKSTIRMVDYPEATLIASDVKPFDY